MKTPQEPSVEAIQEAAKILREGGLVILPTETVYGLAADALNTDAIRKVFAAKGRPADNPLIVHVGDMEQARRVVADWSESAAKLAKRFWPGPLTLALRKAPIVPDATTAGLETVAIRMPDHPVALAVIQEAKTPLAAPSANPFSELSATRVEDLNPALVAAADLVLDGGPCRVGLESSVVDLAGELPMLLRPGGVSRADIESVLGRALSVPGEDMPRRSPGNYPKHYSPKAPLRIVERLTPTQSGLVFGRAANDRQFAMPAAPDEYAASLYAALHRIDAMNPETIYVQAPPREPSWEAVWDRLTKAASS